jgi:PIN domain nuclease of toxin-antitoxin system
LKLLLDTNALIWWLEDNRKLGPRARRKFANPRTETLATIVSLWEITIKHRSGKWPLAGTEYLPILADQQIDLMGLSATHLLTLNDLPMRHGDPFDHLILAQAKAEGATLMTSDERMMHYGVPCIGTD